MHEGRPFFHHMSRAWIVDEKGDKVRGAAIETGFLRPKDNAPPVAFDPQHRLRRGLVRHRESVEIEIITDAVVRTRPRRSRSAGTVSTACLRVTCLRHGGHEAGVPAAPPGSQRVLELEPDRRAVGTTLGRPGRGERLDQVSPRPATVSGSSNDSARPHGRHRCPGPTRSARRHGVAPSAPRRCRCGSPHS
jgi:hypothetical protein